MTYNKKVVHSRHYVEIWEYSKPIIIKGELVEEIKNENEEKEAVKRRTFEELTDEEQTERLKRMKETRLKTKWKLMRLIDANVVENTSFLTLTTKKCIEDRDEFTKMFKSFIKRFNYQVFDSKKSVLKYIGVLERQKRGAWHIHLLLFDVPFVPHTQLLEMWGHGAIRINKLSHLDSASNIGRYVSKYMEKGIGQNLLESFGKKSYLASKNLKKIDESKFYSKDELEFDESVILYETNYCSKVFHKGKLLQNNVRYRKIKLSSKEVK